MGSPVGNELVAVIGVQSGLQAATTEYFTTQDIANLGGGGGGGGGYTAEQVISSGTTATTVAAATNVLWNSATTGAKTNTIPTATGSKKIITITDVRGTAGLYPITAAPVSGSVTNGQNQVYTNGGSLTLYDSSIGWIGQ